MKRERTTADGAAPEHVVLRTATTEDLSRIAEIERASFADPWSPASFRTVLRHAYAALTVAAEEGRGPVLGYSVMWFAADEAELANLAVATEARGRGIGGALLDAALVDARSRGALTVYLEVRDSNGPARRLYASRSFTEVGRRRNYYRHPIEDAVVMRRVLEVVPEAPSD